MKPKLYKKNCFSQNSSRVRRNKQTDSKTPPQLYKQRKLFATHRESQERFETI